MRRAYFMLAGTTGARHDLRAAAQAQAERDTRRDHWAAFCEAWLRLGAAIANGYGPEAA